MAKFTSINAAARAYLVILAGENEVDLPPYSSEVATTLKQISGILEENLTEEQKGWLPELMDYNSIPDVLYRLLQASNPVEPPAPVGDAAIVGTAVVGTATVGE